jgi:UDP-3-O-[3-hydroxymyristoyl] glucosamine N-acyltransferase
MADPRFFKKKGPFTLGQLATKIGVDVPPDVADRMISDVAPLDQAGPDHLSFIDNPKYNDQFRATKAGVCLIRPDMADQVPSGTVALVTKQPYKHYAFIAQMFYDTGAFVPVISDRAVIDPSATLGSGCRVDAGVVIGRNVKIGDGVWIEPNAVIGDSVEIGDGCRIGANASVYYAIIGQKTRIYPGARIGQDGFGFAMDPSGFVKVPQLGRVIIGNGCEIGANTCIDRGAGPDTIIGDGTWIDNLVQIGHNVKIGRSCVLVSQVGIAGSTIVEDFVAMGGQVGVAGHLRIGAGAQIAAQSGIMSDVEKGVTMMGYPAEPKVQFMRSTAALRRLAHGQKKSTTKAGTE